MAWNVFAILLLLSASNTVKDSAALVHAQAMNKEIQGLPNLPDATRDAAFRDVVRRISEEPSQYSLALASNLAVSAGEVPVEPAIVQQIADLLVEELRGKSDKDSELAIDSLADFAFYRHIQVRYDSPRYRADLVERETEARVRASADFTLMDTRGKHWHLRDLRGDVVLVNFWATWCPPCQREMPDLQATYNRFADKGLLILAITDEGVGTVKHYLQKASLTFPVLLDTVGATEKHFLVNGFPHSVLYNRKGKMIAQIPGPVTKKELEDVLAQAGLE
jgi:peroxiredoxin